ncbi:hypothetical protein, partial [Streptomyces sp. NPDC051000]|uniref:hypothetical protein n=1 Tax=Streptomyces sp. NPDC051000 TaxID=3155520 RepID=UPI0033FB0AF3
MAVRLLMRRGGAAAALKRLVGRGVVCPGPRYDPVADRSFRGPVRGPGRVGAPTRTVALRSDDDFRPSPTATIPHQREVPPS